VTEIIFHPEANDEYEQAWAWYYERSARAARRFDAEMARMFELVLLNPESFPAYDNDYRFFVMPHFSYTVVYEVLVDAIHVLAVAQAGRAPGYWKRRR
jgi:plasmid stabilization system protein ParE